VPEQAHRSWFLKGLSRKLEALEIARARFEQDPATHVEEVRRLAAALRAASEALGHSAIATSAATVETAPVGELPAHLQHLISLLRAESAAQPPLPVAILVIGREADLGEVVRRSLGDRNKKILFTPSVEEADHILQSQDVVLVVVDLLLHGQDARDLIARLRARPATAATPVVALVEKLTDQVRHQLNLLPGVDGCFEKPVDPEKLATFISRHLQRALEVPRPARRDRLTGLLNRAAFCEALGELIRNRKVAGEPLTLALVGIVRFENLSGSLAPAARDDLLRQVAAVLTSAFRTTDLLARWTVSEFAVALPGEDHLGAGNAIQKALDQWGARNVQTQDGTTLAVTLCAGFTVVTDPISVDEAADRADRFLYAAYFLAARQPSASCVVSDATKQVPRTERVALCMHDVTKSRVLRQLLEREGLEVTAFDHGDVALQELGRTAFDLVIADEDLPADGAFTLIAGLRTAPAASKIPILLLASGDQAIKRGMELGADDYAVKPVSLLPFVARVRRLLTHGEQASAPARYTVLIVDHELSQLLVAGTALHRRAGARVLLARTLEDGLARLVRHTPDLVLLDLQMPEPGLANVLQQVPVNARTRRIVFVPAVSGGAAAPPVRLTSDTFSVQEPISRPYKPGPLVEELRQRFPELRAATVPTPEDERWFEAEVRRLLQA